MKVKRYDKGVSYGPLETDYHWGGFGQVSLQQTGSRSNISYCIHMKAGNTTVSQIEEFIGQLQKAVKKAKQLQTTYRKARRPHVK
jgi:hypothetical protein